MKMLIIKSEVHFIEAHETSTLELISDREIWDHDVPLVSKLDGVFDNMTAFADTQGILDKYKGGK